VFLADVFRHQFEGAKRNRMSDRGFLFLFSLLMIVFGLGAAVWLFATGQAGTVDGLFMLLTALLIAVVFGLYVMYAIRRALEAATPKPAQTAKAGAAAPAAKRTPTPAAQA
jgi:bacteriorhodopsin